VVADWSCRFVEGRWGGRGEEEVEEGGEKNIGDFDGFLEESERFG